MVTIDSRVDRQDGVTLVTATIAVEGPPARVTVETALDGPVWPPRRQGRPEAGWQSTGSDGAEGAATYTGVVPSAGTLALGFASPAEPTEPPVEVTDVELAADDADEMATPEAVFRGLGDPSPPSLIRGAREREHGHSHDPDPSSGAVPDSCGASSGEEGTGDGGEPANTDRALPPELADWLTAVEDRLDCAENLEATASVPDATTALESCGGVEGAKALDAQVATDAERLRTLAERASVLTERAESTAVATDALDRLT